MTIIMIKHCIYKSIKRGIVIIERVYLCPVSTQLCIREGEGGSEGEGGAREQRGRRDPVGQRERGRKGGSEGEGGERKEGTE